MVSTLGKLIRSCFSAIHDRTCANIYCSMLVLIGVVYRIVAYLGLVFINRKRQR